MPLPAESSPGGPGGVRLNRGAGAGCTTPSTSTNVPRWTLCGCAPDQAAIGMAVDVGFEPGPGGYAIPSFVAVAGAP